MRTDKQAIQEIEGGDWTAWRVVMIQLSAGEEKGRSPYQDQGNTRFLVLHAVPLQLTTFYVKAIITSTL
jgi:hypothetical protein